MTRYIAIFAALLVFCLALMAALMSQYGLSLLDPQMQTMLLVCVLVAAYVSWRITRILQQRAAAREYEAGTAGERRGRSLFGSFSGGKSKALLAREARLAARKRQLVAEGKLAPEEADLPPPVPEDDGAPTRAAASASVKEKMAARAERVRRAREEGKI
ncbi:MAG: hypothetical protein ACK46Q_08800 [Hyphomonas sp.]